MRILIDILHPAHVNFFRNFIKIMEQRGHKVIITAREKDVALELLRAYKLPYIIISVLKKGALNLAIELITRTVRLIRIAREFKPNVMLGVMGPSISIAGKLLNTPSLVFYNNETAKLTNAFVYRLATYYITSTSYSEAVPSRHITYNGYHELAYLHPNYFNPNKRRVRDIGIDPDKKVFLLRFVSWQSSHDFGAKGFRDKVNFVKKISQYGQVVISAEKQLSLPKQLQKYAIKIPPHYLSEIVSFAHLYIGESASVASDAACMGVPAIYLANTKRGYTNEQEEKFGLVYNFTDQELAMKRAVALAKRSKESINKEFQAKRAKMLEYTIDVTKWMVDFVENFKK